MTFWNINDMLANSVLDFMFEYGLVLSIVNLLATFYVMVYCARVMATAQLERPASRWEGRHHFWWIVLLVIGAYYLQPIINQLVIDYTTTDVDHDAELLDAPLP